MQSQKLIWPGQNLTVFYDKNSNTDTVSICLQWSVSQAESTFYICSTLVRGLSDGQHFYIFQVQQKYWEWRHYKSRTPVSSQPHKFVLAFYLPSPSTVSSSSPSCFLCIRLYVFFPYLLSFPSPTLSPLLSFFLIFKSWTVRKERSMEI